MNRINFSGSLTSEPKIIKTMNNREYMVFTVANEEDNRKKTIYANCIAWNKDQITVDLQKGTFVNIEGKLGSHKKVIANRNYDFLEIVVESVKTQNN